MKYQNAEKINKRVPRSAWLVGLAAIALAPFGLPRQADAQTPPRVIQQIPPQQLQDIQRAIQLPPNPPSNQLLVPPLNNNSPFIIDDSQIFDDMQQLEGNRGSQGQPLLQVDPYYQSGSYQRDLRREQTSPRR